MVIPNSSPLLGCFHPYRWRGPSLAVINKMTMKTQTYNIYVYIYCIYKYSTLTLHSKREHTQTSGIIHHCRWRGSFNLTTRLFTKQKRVQVRPFKSSHIKRFRCVEYNKRTCSKLLPQNSFYQYLGGKKGKGPAASHLFLLALYFDNFFQRTRSFCFHKIDLDWSYSI